jgi:hypothetical protein
MSAIDQVAEGTPCYKGNPDPSIFTTVIVMRAIVHLLFQITLLSELFFFRMV